MSAEGRDLQQRMLDRISMEGKEPPTFDLLSDLDHAVIDRYGLFNPTSRPERPVPHPTTLVIDQLGVVRWKFVETDYRIRAENEDILAELEKLREESHMLNR